MSRSVRLLYLCYFPLSEPLVETQVRSYLRGLAAAGHEVHLLTFEVKRLSRSGRRRRRAELAGEGITWHGLRYHKRPSLAATAFDVLAGIVVSTFLVRRRRIEVLHARTHVPAAMALAVRRLAPAAIVFDIRGLVAEEYVDAGTWRQGSIGYRLTKATEEACLRVADGVVVLTDRARSHLFGDSSTTEAGAPVLVIPSSADVEGIAAAASRRDAVRSALGYDEGNRVLVYAGKFSTWYMAEETARFVLAASSADPAMRFLVLTQSGGPIIASELTRAGVPKDRWQIMAVRPDEVGAHLAAADLSISFIRDSPSKIASSPTKIGEYLAAGLPIVTSPGVGDVDALLTAERVGVVVSGHDPDGYDRAYARLVRLGEDPEVRRRCAEVARRELSLTTVGIPRYLHLYELVAGRIDARRDQRSPRSSASSS